MIYTCIQLFVLCFVVVVVVVFAVVVVLVVVHQFYVCGKAQFNFDSDEQIYE